MNVTYDTDARATYIQLTAEDVVETREVVPDLAFVDIDAHAQPVGVEFLVLPYAVTDELIAEVVGAFPTLDVLMKRDHWLLPV